MADAALKFWNPIRIDFHAQHLMSGIEQGFGEEAIAAANFDDRLAKRQRRGNVVGYRPIAQEALP